VELTSPAEFTLFVRIPGWLGSPAKLSVNEKAISLAAEPRTFAAIRRKWQNNDTVQIELPFSFRFEPVDELHPDTVALMWGPLMLVALDSPIEISKAALAGPASSLKMSPYSPSQFELPRTSQKLRFKPFYQVQDELYTTYIRQV
jgi:hypothetical protein